MAAPLWCKLTCLRQHRLGAGKLHDEGTCLCVDLRLVRQPGGEVTHRNLIPIGVPELCSYGPRLLHQ